MAADPSDRPGRLNGHRGWSLTSGWPKQHLHRFEGETVIFNLCASEQ